MNAAYQNPSYGASNLSTYLEQKTLSAAPLELVAMLYSRAISEIQEARRQLAARNISLRSKSISKACDVIGELDSSLDLEAGGELAIRLRSLYRYSLVRLLDANLQQLDEPLAEVLGLLGTMSEAWQAIARKEPTVKSLPGGPDRPGPASSKPQTLNWSDGVATGRSHSWTL